MYFKYYDLWIGGIIFHELIINDQEIDNVAITKDVTDKPEFRKYTVSNEVINKIGLILIEISDLEQSSIEMPDNWVLCPIFNIFEFEICGVHKELTCTELREYSNLTENAPYAKRLIDSFRQILNLLHSEDVDITGIFGFIE